MKMYKCSLILWIVFLFSILIVAPLRAQENYAAIYKKISPSVVTINTYVGESGSFGQGSGFFVNKYGGVITNYHVIKGATYASVKTADGQVYPVKNIVGANEQCDLALISVEIPSNLVYPLSMSSRTPEVGEPIIVIGSPQGFEQSLSTGIVSGFRKWSPCGEIMQITAPISKGSSGGPVLNMKGHVVGIAVGFLLVGQNINFAIPGQRILNLKPGEGQTLSQWEPKGKEDWAVRELYATGLRFLWAGNYKEALYYFKELLDRNFSVYETYFFIGYCLQKLDRPKEAVDGYKQASILKPDFHEVHFNLGLTYRSLRLYQDAIESFTQASWIKSDNAETYLMIGLTFEELGRNQEAVKAYKQAIRVKSNFREAYLNLGFAYMNLEDYRNAKESYKHAIQIKSDYAEAHYVLGFAYLKLGQFKEAIKSFEEALRLKPEYANFRRFFALGYLQLGRYTEAAEALEETVRMKPDDVDSCYNLGLAYLKLNRYKEAIDEIETFIRTRPNEAEAYYNLGVAYWESGQLDEAAKAYQKAVQIKPDYGTAHYNLGVAYEFLGRHRDAIDAFKYAIRNEPNHLESFSNLGVAYHKLGRYKEAVEVYQEAIQLNPNFSEAHYNLAYAYLMLGNKTMAMQQYKILKNIEPNKAKQLFDLIDNKKSQGLYLNPPSSSLISTYPKLESVRERGAREREIFERELKSRVPDWIKIREDAAFIAWIDDIEPSAKKPRKELLKEAYNKFDAEEVAFFYAKFYGVCGANYLEQRQFDEALGNFNKVIFINPSYAGAYISRGWVFLRKNLFDEALRDFNKSLSINPNDPGGAAHNGRGFTKYKKRQYSEAVEDLNEAIRINSNHPAIYYNRGYAYLELGNNQSATADFQKSIELNKNKDFIMRDCYIGLSVACFRLNKIEDAKADYQKAIEIEPLCKNGLDAIEKRDDFSYTPGNKQTVNEIVKLLRPTYSETQGTDRKYYDETKSHTAYFTREKELEKLRNSAYHIYNLNGEEIKLTDGICERGSSSSDYLLVQMFQVAFGDLNDDGEQDAVVIIGMNGGGSGFFIELAAVVFKNGSPYHAASADLGDRVKIESIFIKSGEIVIHMLTHGPNDGRCCPTVKTVVKYKLSENKLVRQ